MQKCNEQYVEILKDAQRLASSYVEFYTQRAHEDIAT